MRAAGMELGEATFTMLVRVCAVDDAPAEAEGVLAKMKARNLKLKLRTFSPLLKLRCRRGELAEALAVAAECRDKGIELSEAEHVALVDCRAGRLEAGGDAASLPGASVLDDLAADCHAPSRAAWPACRRYCAALGLTACAEESAVSGDGACAVTGAKLRSLDLSEAERALLLEQIEGLVPAVDAKFEGQSSAQELERLAGRRMAQWRTFKAWLAKAGAPYDCIIDGANVGYHGANYAGAPDAVDFRQVDAVLRKCIDGGRRALVVLHARHLQDDRLPASARPVLHAWRRSKSLYSCALRNNDDWYWLYAAVAAGPGSLLVSNDEMRDHHFGMLSARAFLVWKERHLAKFELGGWRRDGGRDVTIHDPPPFSVRAQRNDPGEALARWHLPALPPPPAAAPAAGKYGPADKPRGRDAAKSTVVVHRPKLDAVKWLVCSKP